MPYLLLGFFIWLILWILMIIFNFIMIFFIKSKKKAVAAEPKRQQSVSQEFQNVYCSSCGAEILDITGGFCSKCGTPLK